MIFINEPLDIHRSPAHLLPIYLVDQGLLGARIFLAHAARLRHTTFSARVKFGGFLHSFNPKLRLTNAETGCAVKGGGPQRELNPPGSWFAPPGSNRSSGGGNEAAEAFDVEGRIGDSASVQTVT